MLKSQPKTLAKTLAYIGIRAPAEFGLFWDPDGTMPWKEFYWALQEEPSLRFVRESNIRELTLLGVELPFRLDGRLLRLAPGVFPPEYPPAGNVPERLYFAARPKNLVSIQNFGLRPVPRPFLPLCADREPALRIGRRREPEPVVLEVLARKALGAGISFLVAGDGLYLAEAVPAEFLLIPKIREDAAEGPSSGPEKKQKQKAVPPSPGSFVVQPHHIENTTKRPAKGKKDGWKDKSRKERRKRDV